jgi:hypothetical protein
MRMKIKEVIIILFIEKLYVVTSFISYQLSPASEQVSTIAQNLSFEDQDLISKMLYLSFVSVFDKLFGKVRLSISVLFAKFEGAFLHHVSQKGPSLRELRGAVLKLISASTDHP